MIFQATFLTVGLVYCSHAQQFSGNSISSFVGQLTNLINQNGGLGALGALVQQQNHVGDNIAGGGGSGGFGLYQRPGAGGGGGRPPYLSGYPATAGPYDPEPHYEYPPQPGYPDSHQQQPYPFYPPSPYPPYPSSSGRPSLIQALASISRHDDLKCVPRLLCEVTSGGKPGYSGSEPSVVPLTNKENLIAFLTVMNFVDDSPLLTFGRAALIGYTARGNSRACLNAYPTCPRDPDALVDYLNNHKGGFFRFFGGGAPQQAYSQPSQYPGYYAGQEAGGQGLYSSEGPNYHPYDYAGNFRSSEHYAVEERIQNRPATGLSASSVDYNSYRPSRDSRKVVFPEDNQGTRGDRQLSFPTEVLYSGTRNFFPDRTGTGNLLLDHNRIHYSGPDNLINFRDQRSVKFPVRMTFPSDE